jgi:hypothetical protein
MRLTEKKVAGIAAMLAIAAFSLSAEEWTFPDRAGWIDVVVDSGVDNTGKTDVTAKLNRLFANITKRQAIYFPNGTYLVSGSVFSPDCGAGGTTTGPVVFGQSRKGSVIRLKDGTWPTDNITISTSSVPGYTQLKSRVVLNGGDCGNTAFGKEMHNFTVDLGNNNDGAIGVNWSTAN